MGGEIFELPSEKLIRETTERVTAEVTAEYEQQIADLKAQIEELKNKQTEQY